MSDLDLTHDFEVDRTGKPGEEPSGTEEVTAEDIKKNVDKSKSDK